MLKLTGISTAVCGALLVTACASTTSVTVPAPVTPTVSNAPAAEPPASPIPPASRPAKPAGSWNIAYAPGSYGYTIQTDGTIAAAPDTAQKQPLPQQRQHVTITISAAGDVQVTDPAASVSTACDSTAALITRAQQLLPRIPTTLLSASTWRDSTTTTGCRGMIPATSTVISNYSVVGDTIIGTAHLLQIQRADSITANGEGSSGQHRILMTATGTGLVHAFLDPIANRLVLLTGSQSTLVSITTSGRLERFQQNVTESARLDGFQ